MHFVRGTLPVHGKEGRPYLALGASLLLVVLTFLPNGGGTLPSVSSPTLERPEIVHSNRQSPYGTSYVCLKAGGVLQTQHVVELFFLF